VPDGTPGLMPLKTGNIWYYQKKMHDANGAVTATGNDTIAIVAAVVANNIVYFQLVWTSMPVSYQSFINNIDSVTVQKIDSVAKYTFFKKVSSDGAVDSWSDTVTSHCPGQNQLYAYAGESTVNGYTGCLKNGITVNDCTSEAFQKWVYYLKPGVGLVRIEHYLVKDDRVTFYLDFEEDLKSYNLN